MDRLSAPEQNAIGAYFANLLRRVEQDSGPEFLPRGLDVMGLVRQLALPSAETVEKMSYGDPLFRMPTQSNIPITTDRGYVAEVLGMAPAVPAASRATTRISNEMADQLVKAIMGNPQATAPAVLEAAGQMAPLARILGSGKERVTRFGDVEYDPRYDLRVKEQPRIQETTVTVEPTADLDAPVVYLPDYEGFPFITSMSDRTAAGGLLTAIDDVALKRPVDLPGGQDFMFANPGQVWASASGPVNQIMKNAQVLREVTGKDPLFIPWRMAPSGGDFATFTGETMLSYAESALPKSVKKSIDKEIKKIAGDWKGIDSPESIDQYQSLPDAKRKKIKQVLDVNFRDLGGLNIGQARLAVSDPKQLAGQDAGIMNVGRVFSDQPVIQASGHPSYPRGVPGEGVGRVDRDISIFELLPRVVEERGIPSPTAPRQTDIRALQMKPYAGILDEETLKRLGY
jgi:hypothetical protein